MTRNATHRLADADLQEGERKTPGEMRTRERSALLVIVVR